MSGNCKEFEQLVDAQVRGVIGKGEAERLAAHLAQCPGCRANAESQLTVHQLLADAAAMPAPAIYDAWPAVEQRICGRLGAWRWASRVVPVAAGAAAVLVWLLRPAPTPQPVGLDKAMVAQHAITEATPSEVTAVPVTQPSTQSRPTHRAPAVPSKRSVARRTPGRPVQVAQAGAMASPGAVWSEALVYPPAPKPGAEGGRAEAMPPAPSRAAGEDAVPDGLAGPSVGEPRARPAEAPDIVLASLPAMPAERGMRGGALITGAGADTGSASAGGVGRAMVVESAALVPGVIRSHTPGG